MSVDGAAPVTPDDVELATRRLDGRVRRTPTITIEPGPLGGPIGAVLKLELLQHTGSFKPRGAFNRVLHAGVIPAAGLIAASGGNHGAAVAHVARMLGVPAEVFVPSSSPTMKVDRIRRLGAEVVVGGAFYPEAQEACDRRAAASGALLVHPYDHVDVVAGQGTVFRELEEQAPGVDTVLVAVGGGGLVAGAAAWFAGRVKVVAVEPERSCCLHAALVAGAPVSVEIGGLAADSLGARQVGELAFALAQRTGAASVLVTDEAIADAQQMLWSELRIVAEPGGAAALAALLSGVYRPEPNERVAVVVCGGNLDLAAFAAR